jgi:hypothetical protein
MPHRASLQTLECLIRYCSEIGEQDRAGDDTRTRRDDNP